MVLWRKHIGPFVGEYERKLQIVRPDGHTRTFHLYIAGGSTFIETFFFERQATPYLYLRDRMGSLYIDLDKVALPATPPLPGEKFGAFDERDGLLTFVPED